MSQSGISKPRIAAKAVCFTAGTPVRMLNGDKPIEEIQPGDVVLSWDPETEEPEYKTVTWIYRRESSDLYDVRIQGEETALHVTGNHPFFAREGCPGRETKGRWISVAELRSGFEVMRPDGKWVGISRIQRVSGKFRVYNFEVADNHNYFVGKQGILAHNQCGKARFVVGPNGETVDTQSTPSGRHIQPDGSATDILQNAEHPTGDAFVDRTHTHDAIVHKNPLDPTKGSIKLSKSPRPVSTQDVLNIITGVAKRGKPRGR